MKNYPIIATERFDNANLHIRYCLSFLKKYIMGNILEIGAGCGSFTRHYTSSKINKITLTDLDKKNYRNLKIKFKNFKHVKILDQTIYKITKKFDTILYLHVLEHIKKDVSELKEVEKKLNKNGYLVIMVPAHQKLYGNFDKAVGHFRRYERKFFKKKLNNLSRVRLMSLDSSGYILYYLNRFFFSNETFPSNFKIFIWDKIFTPISVIFDFITNYNFGKCIIAIYKKK